jgi:hypothetical protein
MSAGDVKFIGWTGTNPLYRELEPSISYEPFKAFQFPVAGAAANFEIREYVRAKVTRTIILFSKDKDSFIAGLDFRNNALNLTYIDADGSIKTKTYGNGWDILTFDESPAAKGFTQIRLSYEKAIPKALAFFGVDGLSVDCLNGVCRIRYKNNNLETIDSGTGTCGSGLNFRIEKVTPEALSKDPYDETNRKELLESAFYRITVLCNDVIADTTELVGSDLPLKNISRTIEQRTLESSTISNEYPTYESAVAAYEIFENANLWTGQQIQNASNGIKASYPDTENIKYSVSIVQSPVASYTPTILNRWKLTATISRIAIVTQRTTTPSIPAQSPNVAWSKTGNTIRLSFTGASWVQTSYTPQNVFWKKTIREYDVTGIS